MIKEKGHTVSLEEIEAAALNGSISDEVFFEMLVEYWDSMDAKDRKSESVHIVDSPEFLQREHDTAQLRTIVENRRPAIPEMLLQLLKEQHIQCSAHTKKMTPTKPRHYSRLSY